MNLCMLGLCLALSARPAPPRDKWVAEDKWKHFFTSFVATSLAASAARATGLSPQGSALVGAGAGGAAGVWKELHDRTDPKGDPSFKDLVWDAAGVGAGAFVATR
ncbi:MAG: hypothetical protein JO040_04970, partial [Gemmatimonadetes bacterium]|nr:hypothetical protein [Gemmatimonadota bacterium]